MKAQQQSGMVLPVVVLFSILAAVFASALYFATSAQLRSTQRHVHLERAFFIAEAGVERAKAELMQVTGGFNDILLGADGIPNTADDGILSFGPSVQFGGGEYSVQITDNADDGDPDPFVDTDDTVVIWSTGTFRNASRTLEVCVNFELPVTPPISSDGAMVVYGDNTEISLRGSALIDGRDYNVPEDFFCSGSGCLGSVTTNTPTPGVFSASTSSVVTTSGSAQIVGDPPVVIGDEAAITEDYWADLAEVLIENAGIIIPGGVIAGNQVIGTREHPEITLLTGNTRISGNVDGAGILIVTSEVDIDLTGTFHYEGIVLFVGDGSKLDDRGTASFFGSMVSIGRDTKIAPFGSPQIMYSSQALANLANLVMSRSKVTVVYWRQVK